MTARADLVRRPWAIFLALVAALAAMAVLLPAMATAAQSTAKVTLKNPLVSPGIGSFGRYNINISDIGTPGFPFLAGDKRAHCVEFDQGAATGNGVINSDGDIALRNDANGALGNARVKWLALASYHFENSPAPLTTPEQVAAAQSAIWALTNPTAPLGDLANVRNPGDPEAFARAKELYAVVTAPGFSADWVNRHPSVTAKDATALCAGGAKRTVTLKGAAWTTVTVSVPAGATLWVGGVDKGTSTSVLLDADGEVDVQVSTTGAGDVEVTGQFKKPAMVQSRNGPDTNRTNQDFVYLEFQDFTKKTTLTFLDCKDLVAAKTATPQFTRTFDWTIDKSVVGAATKTTDQDTVQFDYKVEVTKTSGVDSGWTATGTITVTNPNAVAVSGVQVTDQIQGGPSCPVTGGSVGTMGAGQQVQLAYTCTFAQKPAYATDLTNKATVTWQRPGLADGSVTAVKAFQFTTPTTILNDSVNVTDAFNGNPPAALDPASTSVTRTYTYSRTLPVPSTKCVDYPNVARIQGGTVDKSDSATVTACREAKDLTVQKSATPTFTRTFDWTIDKSVTGDAVKTSDQNTVDFAYKIVVTKLAGTDSGWKATGQITVSNPNTFAVAGVTVTDTLPGATCAITGGGANQTIPAKGNKAFDYTCTFASKPAYASDLLNTAKATWTKADYGTPSGEATGTKSFQFTAPTTVVNDSVNVADNFNGGGFVNLDPAVISASRTYDYARTVTVPETKCTEFPNVARIKNNGLEKTDAAKVTACRTAADLTVQKTATPTFTRTFDWTITKDADATSKATTEDTIDFTYQVVATKLAGVDSAWTATGTITVANPNTFAVSGVDVTDALPNAQCQVTGGANQTIPAKGDKAFAYACTFAQKPAYATDLTNTATATWTKADYDTPSGSAQGTKKLQFTTPTTTLHDQVVITDTFPELAAKYTLAERTITQTTQFTYTKTVAVPDKGCAQYDNTASLTATDEGLVRTADKAVDACREAQDLSVAKTAVPRYERTFPWTITKAATPATQTVSGDTAQVSYSVTATKGAAQDSAFTVTGQITITNPNRYPVSGVDAVDRIIGGPACTITGGGTGLEVPKKTGATNGVLVLDYACALEAKADGTNTVTVTWPAAGSEEATRAALELDEPAPTNTATATQAFAFGAPAGVTNDSADVRDAFNGGEAALIEGGAGITQTTTFPYTRTVAVPASGCISYPNVATVTAAGTLTTIAPPAAASAEVCRQAPPPPVTPPAPPSNTAVTPVVPPANTPVKPGNARLAIDKSAPRSALAGQVVRYRMTVTNTSRTAAKGVVLTDTVPGQMSLSRRSKGASITNGTLTWRLGALAPGTSRSVVAEMRLDAQATGQRCNVAAVRATNAAQQRDRACTRIIPVAARVQPAVTG